VFRETIIAKIRRNLGKEGIKKIPFYFALKSFHFFEKYLNIHITPVHFYSPIPETHRLNSKIFDKIYDCIGIDWNLNEQFEYLQTICPEYAKEYTPTVNPGLSLIDSFLLYAMIRNKKPNTIIEIGAGNSTQIALDAVNKNKDSGHSCKFYSIEPFPPGYLKQINQEGFELIENKVQDVELSLLIKADLLFIDSSHVCKIDSDVNYEILEIVPRLKVGSIVHWHDIMIPTNYWKEWINRGNQFCNESYMVHAFMLFNKSFKIIWASRYMQLNYPEKMKKQFSYFYPDDMEQQNISFWIERVK